MAQTQAKSNNEITIVDNFKLGYRNREDITNLPPGVLVVGSHDVLVNTASRIQTRPGYILDGAKETVNAPIKSSFQWRSKGNGERFLRAGFLTTAANDGKLQFRYDDGTTITWTTLLSSLTSTSYNFTTFWDTTELIRLCLFVNGSNNLYEWNGAYDTVVSVTGNTITMTNNIGTSGFYSTRNKVITIRGVDYTYTGISGSTFTGVSPDPTAQGANTPVAGDLAVQKPVTTAASTFTSGPPSTYTIDLISVLNNQIFIGSLSSSTFYMSKIHSYTDYSFGSPRLPGQGITATVDDNLVGFIPQEDVMYVTAGTDYWYNTQLNQTTQLIDATTSLTTETFQVKLLKTNNLQAAQSQALVNKAGNNVLMVTNEPALEYIGRVDNILGTPQTSNISDPIKIDFDAYDFTGGSVYSWKRYLFVSIPTEGVVRMFNLFTQAWETPLNLPITSFYTVVGELYGHSSVTSESYKLFDGYSDRATTTAPGQPISASAAFSYQNYGTRTHMKNSNEFYMEGYISANTTLTGTLNFETDGCMTTQNFEVDGDDTQIVCIPSDESSLGKVSLGKEKLGGDLSGNLTGLPPKFRVIKTTTRINFYEHQFMFSIFGKDQRFELIAFGTNAVEADDTNFQIKQ